MSITIGGTIIIRNGNVFDFPWVECILSMLPVCDQVVVSEGESSDSTRTDLEALAKQHPKIKIVDYPHATPNADPLWVMNWTNFAREHLDTEYHLQIDADEIMEEGARDKIMAKLGGRPVSLRIRRYNFWRDAQHLIPEGECCASEVIRVAPQYLWIPADIPVPQGQACMDIEQPALNIACYHYGFLRKPEAFFKKERFLQTAFTGGWDPKLEKAEAEGGNLSSEGVVPWADRLQEFKGKHPSVIHRWLIDRGYTP